MLLQKPRKIWWYWESLNNRFKPRFQKWNALGLAVANGEAVHLYLAVANAFAPLWNRAKRLKETPEMSLCTSSHTPRHKT